MIDFHTHIFPEKIADRTLAFLASRCHIDPFTNGTAPGLTASTREAGLELSVVLPVVTKPSQFDSINRFALQMQDPEDGLLSFGGIHPDNGDYKEKLRYIRAAGMKGIKLHPDYQGVMIDDIRYKRIISYATELGLLISVHAGFDPRTNGTITAMIIEMMNGTQVSAWIARIPGSPPTPIALARTFIKLANIPAKP